MPNKTSTTTPEESLRGLLRLLAKEVAKQLPRKGQKATSKNAKNNSRTQI